MARVRVYLVDLAARATDEQRVSLALSVLPTSYEGPWKRYSETVIHANEPRPGSIQTVTNHDRPFLVVAD
jgi:hypothetical protein